MNDDKLLVEVTKARVPLKKLIHGKEIREAMDALESFRQRYNEQEFFYGAKVYLTLHNGECWASVRRPETDKELATRLAAEQRERELKAERKRQRDLAAHARELKQKLREAELARKKELEEVAELRERAAKHGLKLVVDSLDT